MILGICAIRNKSGGAIVHLKGILEFSPITYFKEIDSVVLFTNQKVINELKSPDTVQVVNVTEKYRSTLATLYYELVVLPRVSRAYGIDVMLYTDASALITSKPNLVMSRDMLSFEPGIRGLYSGKSLLRIIIIGFLQRKNLNNSDRAIYLTEYARSVISKNNKGSIVPHGIDESWRGFWEEPQSSEVLRVLYVSNAAPYKGHQELFNAIKILKRRGMSIELTCVGAMTGSESASLENYLLYEDLSVEVEMTPYLSRDKLKAFYMKSDVFIFPSKCENMPNTLVEAVASGIPVITSNNGPMKHLVGEYKYQFNAFNANQIVECFEAFLCDDSKIVKQQKTYLELRFKHFTWENSSRLLKNEIIELC